MFRKSLNQRVEGDSASIKHLEKSKQQVSRFVFWLFSDSISMTNSQKIGSLFLVFIFIVILSPVALSPSDPYHLQEFLEKHQNLLLFLEAIFNSNDLNPSIEYVVIDGIKYRVLFDGEFNIKNLGGEKYLIPGVNDIIVSQRL
jgi:hypothetical protein